MPPIKTEQTPHAGGFLLYEADPSYCREVVTIRSGNKLRAGMVIAELQAGDVQQLEFGGSGSSDVASGILFGDVDATDAALEGVAIVRGPCVVKADSLVWPDGITAQQKEDAIAELAALDIIARAGPATVSE